MTITKRGTIPWRVRRTHKALVPFYENGTTRPQKYERPLAVRDLLADLRHYCDKYGIDFGYEDGIAHGHYVEEIAEYIAMLA